MTTDAWPFLIAPTEASPPRLVVVPGWALDDPKLLAAVREAPLQTSATAPGSAILRPAHLAGERFCLVYRVLRIRKSDYGVGDDEPARDLEKRPIDVFEGFVVRMGEDDAEGLLVGSADFGTVHAAVTQPYQEYWQRPGSFRIRAAGPFSLTGDGERVALRIVEPWQTLEYAHAAKAGQEAARELPEQVLAAQASAQSGASPQPSPRLPRPTRRSVAVTVAVGVIVAGIALGVALLPGHSPHSGESPPANVPSAPSLALAPPSGGAASVSSVAFRNDGSVVAAGDSDGRTYLWAVASGQLHQSLQDQSQDTALTQGINAIAYSPDGGLLAAADQNGFTYVWNSSGRQAYAPLQDPSTKDGVRAIAFSPNGQYLATGDGNGRVYLWNADTGALQESLDGQDKEAVTAVEFSPDNAYIAAGDAGGATTIWHMASQQAGPPIEANLAGNTPVAALAFSPDSSLLVTSGRNGTNLLWNISTLKTVRKLQTPDGRPCSSVAFTSDGRILAAGSDDGRVYLWDPTNGTLLASLADPNSKGVNSVAFSPANKSLATGDANGTTYIWSMAWRGY